MSIAPLITFKAGKCEVDVSAPAPFLPASPITDACCRRAPTLGRSRPCRRLATSTSTSAMVRRLPFSLSVPHASNSFAELCHFCWRPRSASVNDPELDLLMIPGDGSFVPYTGKEDNPDSDNLRSPTDGRIFVLKFSSSSQRHLFWLQSKSQHPSGEANWFSPRDLKIGQIVDMLLSGEEIDVQDEMRQVQNPPRGGDDDETMEDAPGNDHHRQGSGGAGAGATGGDVREEGEEAREGGADGARA